MNLRIVRRPWAHAAALPQPLHPVLGRVYAARGVTSAQQLDHSLERLLPVGTLEGLPAAVELLMRHRSGRVTIIGDFDADGATSSALMVRALRGLGFADVDFLVPNRFEFGYGLTPEIVALSAAARAQPDRHGGQRGFEQRRRGRRARTGDRCPDHRPPPARCRAARGERHRQPEPGAAAPSPAATWQASGVAFYVMAALERRLDEGGLTHGAGGAVAQLLDLVALGTVADVVPLDANNRVLVSQGLRRIRAGRCVPGIRALLDLAGRSMQNLTAADLAFGVAPRLNAAGRIDDMSIGIRCLLSDDAQEAQGLAARLDAAEPGAPQHRGEDAAGCPGRGAGTGEPQARHARAQRGRAV